MYFRRKTSAGRAYLQIVESRRDGDQVRQQVIATLGRFEDLQASGQLERLVRSGARFAAKAMVLSAASNEAAIKIDSPEEEVRSASRWARSDLNAPGGIRDYVARYEGCIARWRSRRRCRCVGRANSWIELRRSAAVACRARILPSGRNGAIAD
jgi:hypothetical protein